MKLSPRLCGVCLLLACLPMMLAQTSSLKIARIDIKQVGPPAASEELIRGNLRVKPGDIYLPTAVDEDVRNLYETGLFYNIHVAASNSASGLILTYTLMGKPRLMDIKFHGNTKFSNAKLKAKLTSKVGEPLDERKLFNDAQEIQKLYQKKGYPNTEVKAVSSVIEESGRATATFEITESPKIKIIQVDFVGAKAFPEKKLRKVVKTRKHWMFSWITGHGFLKDEQLQEDKDKLAEFYRDKGYIDFELKDVQIVNPTPKTMIIKFIIYEGVQYRVGAVKFTGNKLFTTPQIISGLRALHIAKRGKAKLGPNGLSMDVGDIFTPKGLTTDTEQVEDFYGAKGYIDVTAATRNLKVVRIPNIETRTMDLEFQIEEGQKIRIERIEIRGNTKTRDTVIRRELAVSPGETFDMVRVKLSKGRLEGLHYFDRVDTYPEPTDVQNARDLVVVVDEGKTGNATLGAGFSSAESLVGYVEYTESNFDISKFPMHPWWQGAGQKLRVRLAVGTEQQDYEISFIEPWFLGKKLQLGVNLYYRDLAYLSPNNLYDEVQAGGKVGITRALGSDFLRGGLNYTLEDVGINLTSDAITHPPYQPKLVNVPPSIQSQVGYHLLSTVGGSLSYDTRNSTQLSDAGQHTELNVSGTGGPFGGSDSFYKLELRSSWFFKGFAKGHVIELDGRAGVVQAFGGSSQVPFFARYYLGGMYDLRGFQYRNVSPREFNPAWLPWQIPYQEPIGGDSMWTATAEYSIPIFEQEHGVGVRFAVFFDIGGVGQNAYSFSPGVFDDNWGVGIRLNLPIGPIRLDYGIPITHDQFNSSNGQFQFSVGWERPF
ncbi:MAG TPA: outer membrane protein assembly factor BamA [Candidatus Acidoferrum sp.]|nr:outer membrane protein assembly factor BamA [Candidatus Acidoferrum sp.]